MNSLDQLNFREKFEESKRNLKISGRWCSSGIKKMIENEVVSNFSSIKQFQEKYLSFSSNFEKSKIAKNILPLAARNGLERGTVCGEDVRCVG